MTNRLYAKQHDPAWFIRLSQWVFRQRKMLAQDWTCTKRHALSVVKFFHEYRRFRQGGFTRKASQFNARNSVS